MWDLLTALFLASPMAVCVLHFIWQSYTAVFRVAEDKGKAIGDVARQVRAVPTVERTYCCCSFSKQEVY
jgi:hypothetical protein